MEPNEYLEIDRTKIYPEHIHFVSDGRGLRTITVDGKEVTTCVYADIEKGVVIAYQKDANDKIMYEAGNFRYKRLTGKVEVTPLLE